MSHARADQAAAVARSIAGTNHRLQFRLAGIDVFAAKQEMGVGKALGSRFRVEEVS